MPRIEVNIDVPGPPSSVFRFCHDVDRRAEWDERVDRVKVITPRPIRTGTVIRVDTPPPRGGPVFSWEGEFVSYSCPSRSRLIVIDAAPSSYFADGSEEWSFSRSGDGTRIRVVWEYEPRGLLGRIRDALGGCRATRGAVNESLTNLERTLEAQA